MSRYGYANRTAAGKTGDFHERAFRRRGLADWDAKWHGLSPGARSAFINTMKGPARTQADHAPNYLISKDRFPPEVLDELVAAGFAKLLPARSKKAGDRAFAPAALFDFATRVRMLDRSRLLIGDRLDELTRYVNYAFDTYALIDLLRAVLRAAGMEVFSRLEVALERYVRNYRWPAWVGRVKKDPAAERVIRAVHEAGGPVAVVDLPGRVTGMDLEEARAAMDRLIARLVLFEGLDPRTSDIVVGFLPVVREGLERAGRPRSRPPMVACERPQEVGPDDSPVLADLRAFLLEVAAEPPRLRQDRSLFQKETERFRAGLAPLPSWLSGLLGWSDEGRIDMALAWARQLRLVEDVAEGPQYRLGMTAKGRRWLAGGLDAQYATAYALLNTPPKRSEHHTPYWKLFAAETDRYYWGSRDDTTFLGQTILVRKAGAETKYIPDYWEAKPGEVLALREAIDRALAALEPGVFYRLKGVAAHLSYGEHNPIHLGLDPKEVVVVRGEEPIPPLEELREEAGRSLIEGFIARRLIPMGCVRAAVDAEGDVCIARGPRLDAYFGREVAATDLAPAVGEAARVVVQPDFSVIVIGPNPAAAAELAPFCDRAAGGPSSGAMVLKITRDSVVRAVANGLEPSGILDRLRRHASHEVPANVLHEVRDWSGWVRRVELEPLVVLRCPDRDTADRVMGALNRQGERLNETMVAVVGKLAAADRGKLRAQGILVGGHAEAAMGRPTPRKKRRRGW